MKDGTNFISGMPTNLYGPGDNFNLEAAHVLPALIRKFLLAKLLRKGDYEGIWKDIKSYPLGFGISPHPDPLQGERIIERILDDIGIIKDYVISKVKAALESFASFLEQIVSQTETEKGK